MGNDRSQSPAVIRSLQSGCSLPANPVIHGPAIYGRRMAGSVESLRQKTTLNCDSDWHNINGGAAGHCIVKFAGARSDQG